MNDIPHVITSALLLPPTATQQTIADANATLASTTPHDSPSWPVVKKFVDEVSHCLKHWDVMPTHKEFQTALKERPTDLETIRLLTIRKMELKDEQHEVDEKIRTLEAEKQILRVNIETTQKALEKRFAADSSNGLIAPTRIQVFAHRALPSVIDGLTKEVDKMRKELEGTRDEAAKLTETLAKFQLLEDVVDTVRNVCTTQSV